ncbi:unnamed protein product [Rhizophagus irregularis]|nr:unnamed protein product [Rhizophagus irregularis]
MEFDFMVDFNTRADNDNKKIIADIEGLFEYFKIIGGGLTDMSKTLSKVFGQLSILNNTENQMITDQKSSKQSENSVPATLEDIKVSLIEELSKILKKRVNKYQTVEHIERICDVMLDKSQLAGKVIENIENLKNFKNHKEEEEYKNNLQLANNIVAEIHRYFTNISQLTESNIAELSKYLEYIIGGLTETNEIVSKVLEQLSVLNNTANKMITDQENDKQGENSANFLPLIEARSKILKIGEDVYQTAENNEKICDLVQSFGRKLEYLKNFGEKYKDFFSKANTNYIDLQKLANNVDAKHEFLTEQLKELDKRDIEKATIYLNKEFDSAIQLLKFDFIVNFNACANRNNEKFGDSIYEARECLDIIGVGLTDMSKTLKQLSVLNSTVNQMITDQKK